MQGEITQLLKKRGDETAERELFERVYATLRTMAARRLRAERREHTIQPTALINEVYIALAKGESIAWTDRSHFYAVAARVMRRFLVDYARGRAAQKRMNGLQKVDLEKAHVFSLDNPEFMLAVNRSIDRLRERSERACQVVELRVFAGLGFEDIATSLGASARTVKRDWQTARLWLYQELYGTSGREASTLG